MEFLQSRKFTGTSNITLEAFLGQHRSTYVTLERCAENINCQLPDERSRVQFLLDNIQADNSNVKAALSSIRLDDTANGMRNNFEAAVSFLLPTDPVEKKKSKSKRPLAEVSAAEGEEQPGKKTICNHRAGRGKSGVEFRYHTPHEYQSLSKEQRSELHAYRKQNPSEKGKGKKSKDRKKRFKAAVSSLVQASLKEIEEEKETRASEKQELHAALIASLKSLGQENGKLKLNAKVSAIDSAHETLPPATLPKGKGQKRVGFAEPPSVKNPFAAKGSNASAEIAAAKPMEVIQKMSSGTAKKNGPP
jgi:hypothetical protein